jgi:N-carbamoyl-L-amino-acid hydrolase
VAVIAFADEEGARFNTPTFGSKALASRLDPTVLSREDDDGITLHSALEQAGLDPDRIHEAEGWLARLKGFLELHIDQTTDLARANEPYGVVTGLAARARLQIDITGRADHAGTTPPQERKDALSAAAHLIVAAEEAAAEHHTLRVTASRIHIEPNANTTIASFVRLWLDARAPEEPVIDAWLRQLEQRAGEAVVSIASRSPAVTFDPRIRETIQGGPELLCFAGHDAGVLQGAGVPAGMVFVRNESGISHSPEEHVDLEDAARAATAIREALEHRLP